ncbi:hypothetical protein NCCP2331_21420 [Sporosarcina sp. NCCP-2331]|nr:hypothetical protein NCCP2331_21420 [Sporosarcina sp. NCCP-2331]GLB56585.1 hypothetical protein NCCP2378_23720 [Sporosarcina sp. NCCP-2378]
MTRFLAFICSYCVIVVSTANLLFYLNYSAMGYTYQQILLFMLQSADFTFLLIASFILLLTVCVPSPLRLPFS